MASTATLILSGIIVMKTPLETPVILTPFVIIVATTSSQVIVGEIASGKDAITTLSMGIAQAIP